MRYASVKMDCSMIASDGGRKLSYKFLYKHESSQKKLYSASALNALVVDVLI
jgi:hypothetical protein